MAEEPEYREVPNRLVGYLPQEMEPPTFIVPVFQNLENDAYVIQAVSNDNKIFEFLPSPTMQFISYEVANPIRRVGDSAIFGLAISRHRLFFGEYLSLIDQLDSLIKSGEFDNFPAFAHSVAKLIGDSQRVPQYQHVLFDFTTSKFEKTKKFFLENNIIRDNLFQTMPSEYRQIIRDMRLDVRGNRINVRLPEEASETIKNQIGRRITNIVKEFTKLSGVKLSFYEEGNALEFLPSEFQMIKAGNFDIEAAIVDCERNHQMFAQREAKIVIPEAVVKRTALTSNEQHLPIQPLSKSTLNKIYNGNMVSLISAVAYRYWLYLNLVDALKKPEYLLHICCFRIKKQAIQSFGPTLVQNGVITKQAMLQYHLFPISFIFFLTATGLINREDVPGIFYRYRGPTLSWIPFTSKAKMNWATYCNTEFRNIERQLIDKVHSEISVSKDHAA